MLISLIAIPVTILVAFINGLFLLSFLWPKDSQHESWEVRFCLMPSLAAGLGLAWQSLLAYLSLVATDSLCSALVAQMIVAIVVTVGKWRTRPQSCVPVTSSNQQPKSATGVSRVHIVMGAILAFSVVTTIQLFFFRWLRAPHGYWDAWAMWTLRAIYLGAGGESWQLAFGTFQSHGDYPLLVPLTTAQLMWWTKAPVHWAACATAGFFVMLTVGLFTVGSGVLRGRLVGATAGMMLMQCPLFLCWGAALYADIPLAFFMLAVFVLWAYGAQRPDSSVRIQVLIGASLGAAAWTKNEGILLVFVCACGMIILYSVKFGWRVSARRIGGVALGLLPFAVALAHFKLCYSPRNDLVSAFNWEHALEMVGKPARWRTIAQCFLSVMKLAATRWSIAMLALLSFILGFRRLRAEEYCCPATLIAMFYGFAIVYVTTPKDLIWHLGTSLDRILLQMTPAAMFTFLMFLRSMESSQPKAAGDSERLSSALGTRPVRTLAVWLMPIFAIIGCMHSLEANDTYGVPPNWLKNHEFFRRFDLSSVDGFLPENVSVGYIDNAGSNFGGSIEFLSARYSLAPRSVEPDQGHDWLIVRIRNLNEADAWRGRRDLKVIHTLDCGILVCRRSENDSDL